MTPRLFKPENNTKAEEFKEFLPVNVTCSFRSLAPAIAQCEDKYLLPILGETLFSRLAAYYEGGTHDNELLEALLKRSQYAVVRLAYWQDYDLLSVSMSDKGAADNAGEGRLYKYQADCKAPHIPIPVPSLSARQRSSTTSSTSAAPASSSSRCAILSAPRRRRSCATASAGRSVTSY